MDPALWELLRAEAGTAGDRELEAVIRLAAPGSDIPGVRIVARFGPIVTCRIRARDVISVRARPDVLSVKAARGLSPGFDPGAGIPDPNDPVVPVIEPTDVRRGPELGPDGTGVVVAAVDWGADVDAAVFRRPDGATRFLALWDQRDQASGARPQPYGYGAVHRRDDIDRALRDPRPYERLGYHPAIADPRGQGTHGTRTLDIAAGNGRSGGPVGIAPEADLLFVHLADRNTGGVANFGDSVRLLEAVDFISRTAGSQPCAINISAGRVCGPKDGTTLVERALDELLASTPGRFVVNSAGNYYRWRTHSRGVIGPGETRPLTFVSEPADVTVNELEIWYDGEDELAVRVEPPGYSAGPPVRLGERADLLADGRLVGRIYHRRHDPNNGGNHVVAYLDPVGLAGTWTVILEARQVSNGRFDAWIERDDSCPGCQARFPPETSSTAITIGSIASSHLPLVVGAVDGHDPARPPASFSSAGPSRDGRDKPDLVAPGVRILAARSAPAGAQHNPGLLVSGNGTSFATPHVTGAVALCLEVAGSRLSAAEIRALVLGSCDPAPAPGLRDRLGHGYLNIPRLVASVQQSVHAADRPHHAKEPAMVPEDTLQLLAGNPALAYREYLYRPRGQLGRWVSDWFEPLAGPAQSLGRPPRAGDVLLEVVLGRPGPGRCAVLAPGDVEPLAAQRRLAPGQLLLRPRPRTEITVPQPAEPPADGDLGWFRPLDDARPSDETEDEPEAEYDPGEAGDQAGSPVPVDAAAAVPPATPTERAAVTQPLLSPQASAQAVAWNTRMHPGASGVSLDQIRAALDSYVDAAAVRAALDRDSAAGSEPDAVLAECVHQFQRKCYREQREHGGRAGQSALDSLGLIERGGPALHSGLRHNARAQQRLNQHDAQVQAATGGQFSAASWFSGITDPAVFGLRTKGGHGLHVLLVRKLRAAERYLLTLPRFRGMTPVALAAALGLSERHGGMRAAQTDSMHTFGLAVDIEYTANPWPHQRASWQAMKRAATLVSGVTLHHDSAPAYFSSLGSNPALSTGQIWDELHQRHTELVGYFRLGQDPAALKTALLASQARGTVSLTHAGEPVDEAITRWQSQITEDRHALAAPDGDFTGRDPAKGFLTHDRDLVIALRDHGCLAWGAVDQGPAGRGSGDMMHFDARIDGAGRVLAWPAEGPAAEHPINFLPAPGHHPCLPSSAAAAPAETADEADGPATADYLDGKLWTFTATTLPLPVAVFCPPAALSQGQVDVLLYAHGLLNPCQPKPKHHPSEFVTDHPFAFGRIVKQAARPLVLVVPLLDWAHPGGAEVFGAGHTHWHALAAPQHLNRLIGEVQAELGRVQEISPPSVGELIIAGHSRAYDFLEPLAHRRLDPAMQSDALARLSQVWAFDTTYAGRVSEWLDWLELNPRLRLQLFYRPGSGTAPVGDEFYSRQGPRLAVTQVSEKHCHIPATRLPALLTLSGPGSAQELTGSQQTAPTTAEASGIVLTLGHDPATFDPTQGDPYERPEGDYKDERDAMIAAVGNRRSANNSHVISYAADFASSITSLWGTHLTQQMSQAAAERAIVNWAKFTQLILEETLFATLTMGIGGVVEAAFAGVITSELNELMLAKVTEVFGETLLKTGYEAKKGKLEQDEIEKIREELDEKTKTVADGVQSVIGGLVEELNIPWERYGAWLKTARPDQLAKFRLPKIFADVDPDAIRTAAAGAIVTALHESHTNDNPPRRIGDDPTEDDETSYFDDYQIISHLTIDEIGQLSAESTEVYVHNSSPLLKQLKGKAIAGMGQIPLFVAVAVQNAEVQDRYAAGTIMDIVRHEAMRRYSYSIVANEAFDLPAFINGYPARERELRITRSPKPATDGREPIIGHVNVRGGGLGEHFMLLKWAIGIDYQNRIASEIVDKLGDVLKPERRPESDLPVGEVVAIAQEILKYWMQAAANRLIAGYVAGLKPDAPEDRWDESYFEKGTRKQILKPPSYVLREW